MVELIVTFVVGKNITHRQVNITSALADISLNAKH